MITPKKRKALIIKYLEKNPLSNPRQIRTEHSEHEYHSKYLKKFLDELVSDGKIDLFLKKYYTVPKAGKEIDLLVNIIKSKSLDKPTFKKLEFIITKKNLTINTLINNCICLYHVKQKINDIENTVSVKSFSKYFIKLLKTYSFDHSYTDDFIIKNSFKRKSKKKENISKNELEMSVLSFLRLKWGYSFEYLTHLKSNKIPLGELFHRIFELCNTDRSTTASEFGTTNKALKFSLDQLITEKGVLSSSTSYDSEFNRIQPEKNANGFWNERSRIIETGVAIICHRSPSTRKKIAKNFEKFSDIPFTKLLPLKGISNMSKNPPSKTLTKNYTKHPQGYYEFYKETGMPPLQVINTKTGEIYYQSFDPTNPGKWNKEWEEIK